MFSDYVAFVDESGDHSLTSVDPHFPMFVLALCVFKKDHYASEVLPALARLKFKYFGHDQVVLHEREIRKAEGAFGILRQETTRKSFQDDLTGMVQQAPFCLIASVIAKTELLGTCSQPESPYSLALTFCLERLHLHLRESTTTHVVVECRGRKEDRDLELEFRRICDGANKLGKRLPFEIVFAHKQTNSPGLQLADLIARPVGVHTLRPQQPNRAYEVLKGKFRKNPDDGSVQGWGLKKFP